MANRTLESGKKRPAGVILVALLWILQSLLRFVFGYLSVERGSLLDVEVSAAVDQTIIVMFFALGIIGFAAVLGFWKMKKWGFWGIVLASVATIIFDVWGMTIQFTAAMGFVVPFLSILYLSISRSKLLEIFE